MDRRHSLQIFHSLEEYRSSKYGLSRSGTAVTLGKFDGVHIGHRKLIHEITQYSKEHGLNSVVFAIEMNDGSILSHEERAGYLKSLGIDILIECPFTTRFMSMSPEEFIRTILADTLHARYAAVGTDFVFGHNRAGDASLLKDISAGYGCGTVIHEKERYQGSDVSSTRIRQALGTGDMPLVNALLGRPYPVCGTVSHGRHIGTTIGVPTVNIPLEEGKILPPDGVYASITHLPDHSVRKGLTNIGKRPTVGGTVRRSETTLFDFHADLYGASIRHELIRFLRPEIKFSSLEELKKQIRADRKEAWG